MRLDPVITEPFRRLVIDTVDPLHVTTSDYRHILTMLCPTAKFPEAVPLNKLSAVEIVNALRYGDDVAMLSAWPPTHLQHMCAVLTRLLQAGLRIKASKCQMARAEVAYLGYVIDRGRRRPSEEIGLPFLTFRSLAQNGHQVVLEYRRLLSEVHPEVLRTSQSTKGRAP